MATRFRTNAETIIAGLAWSEQRGTPYIYKYIPEHDQAIAPTL
jgi:hypothetical protein